MRSFPYVSLCGGKKSYGMADSLACLHQAVPVGSPGERVESRDID